MSLLEPSHMRRGYTSYYRKSLDDSPEKAISRARKIISGLARKLPSKSVYLGIGAGRGFTEAGIYETSLKHMKVMLLDVAKRKPVLAKHPKSNRFSNVVNVEGDAHKLPLKPGSVDLISCLMSQDFYRDRSGATHEMHRVLRPGARAVLFLHHADFFKAEMTRRDANSNAAKLWHELLEKRKLFLSKEEIARFYEAHGFEVESVKERPPESHVFADAWWEVVLKKKEVN